MTKCVVNGILVVLEIIAAMRVNQRDEDAENAIGGDPLVELAGPFGIRSILMEKNRHILPIRRITDDVAHDMAVTVPRHCRVSLIMPEGSFSEVTALLEIGGRDCVMRSSATRPAKWPDQLFHQSRRPRLHGSARPASRSPGCPRPWAYRR